VLFDQPVPAGSYGQIRLLVVADGDPSSSYMDIGTPRHDSARFAAPAAPVASVAAEAATGIQPDHVLDEVCESRVVGGHVDQDLAARRIRDVGR